MAPSLSCVEESTQKRCLSCKDLWQPKNRKYVVLDLKEVKLIDREALRFLARCEENGIKVENCPAYIREWILREETQS